MTEQERVRVRATVSGRVQGVGYRIFAVRAAQGLGLRGLVANRDDGTVSCTVEGPREAVDALVAQLRQGPPAARVASVELREEVSGSPLPRMQVSA